MGNTESRSGDLLEESGPPETRLERYRELQLTDGELATALLAPALILLLAVSFYPIIETFRASLYQGYVLPTKLETFIGLKNYSALFANGSFWNALKVSLIYTFVSVPIELVLGVGVALLLNREFRGRYVAQAAILFPWALPTIINAKIWSWLLNGQYGVINDMLVRAGILSQPYAFLSHPNVAFASMICITIWKTTSFMALLMLAGLSGIPSQLYEAARMDGASRWRRFRDVTLPLLKPTILVALIFRTLPALQAFGLPYGLTGGGPGESTDTLVLFTQQQAFSALDFGSASASATAIAVVALGIAMLYVGTLYDPEVR